MLVLCFSSFLFIFQYVLMMSRNFRIKHYIFVNVYKLALTNFIFSDLQTLQQFTLQSLSLSLLFPSCKWSIEIFISLLILMKNRSIAMDFLIETLLFCNFSVSKHINLTCSLLQLGARELRLLPPYLNYLFCMKD